VRNALGGPCDLGPPCVGGKVRLAGGDPMAPPVTGQEDDGSTLEHAGAVLVGRIAERRPHAAPAHVGEPVQLVEAAAADDADRPAVHAARTSFSTPRAARSPASVTRTAAV